MSNETNTTIINLSVTLGDTTYNPTLLVADSGTWTINDDGLRAAVSPSDFLGWMADVWAMPEVRGLRA